jgi:integrase
VKRTLAAIRGKTAQDVRLDKPRSRSIVRGGMGTAREAIILLRSIFTWGIAQKLVATNPCIGVKLSASGQCETILEDAASYGRLFQTLDRLEATRIVRSPVADTIRLIALTGCRRGEAIGLRWRHVDLKNDRLVLSPAEHKTGRKTGKLREINLPTAAQAIIARSTREILISSCFARLAARSAQPDESLAQSRCRSRAARRHRAARTSTQRRKSSRDGRSRSC